MSADKLQARRSASALTRGELLRPKAVAARLGVSTRTLQRWCARGDGPPAVRVGGAFYFRAADLQEWIRALQP